VLTALLALKPDRTFSFGADLRYGRSERGQRYWINSTSPGLAAKRSFYRLYLNNERQGRL
jgi:hypothetical protein